MKTKTTPFTASPGTHPREAVYTTLYDVAVIGGGPAGMMAAGRAAENGANVIVIEKNDTLGKKLLITGGGRCNVTNAELDTRKLLLRYKGVDKFLFSAFSKWSTQDTLDFFHLHQMDTKIEDELRVFPKSDKAQSVWNVLVEYMRKNNVTVLSNSEVTGFETSTDGSTETIEKIVLKNGIIQAKKVILATGGKSRPETGSTGDGFQWLKKLGHTIVEPDAALVPVKISDPWVKRLQGVTVSNVKLTVLQNNQKQVTKKGKILFTHFGISGPTVLNVSKDIQESLRYGEVVISLDLLPSLDPGALNLKLQEVLRDQSNKKLKNVLHKVSSELPAVVFSTIIQQSGIDENTPAHSVTRNDRLKLAQTFKNLTMNVSGLLGVEKAIVTSGGVILSEVDFKTMQSRIVPNLYVVGDILNVDRPSGGYSLQLCWTTGFVAGESAGQ